MKPRIRAIIFDADKMVINQDKLFSQRLVDEFGCDKKAVDEFFVNEFVQCVIGKADLKESLSARLTQLGWQGSVESLLNEWFSGEDKPNKPLIQIIKALKRQDIRCYLATNQEKYRSAYLADKMGFLHLFDYLFFSYEMHYKKPEEKFFAYIWDALSYMEGISHKKEIIFWDDRQEHVTKAHDFGFDAWQYRGKKQFVKVLAEKGILPDR